MPNKANTYHILNGDALKSQFPRQLAGELIICREVLMDGPLEAHSSDEFYAKRAEFLNDNFGGDIGINYEKTILPEFQKIHNFKKDSVINLWFEDDLFCQVNLWYVCNLISENRNNFDTHLIRPQEHSRYGFGGLDESSLVETYHRKTKINDVHRFAELWQLYKENAFEGLHTAGKKLSIEYPFVLPAIEAHLDRIPSEGYAGRPIESLKSIINELGVCEFSVVFKEFCVRESIYGYGDLQVKILLESIQRLN